MTNNDAGPKNDAGQNKDAGQNRAEPSSGRLLSLDVFRGLTMMAMVLVNNPGDGDHVYPPLNHAVWHGCTFTDLIFPFFLFMVGVSTTFSFARRLAGGDSRIPLMKQIFRRTLILFGIGLLLALIPRFDLATLRIPGVLQRIAICYFCVGMMTVTMSQAARMLAGFLLLAIYWTALLYIPVPGFGAGILEPMGNMGWWIDSHLLAGHTWRHAPAPGFDPEGVLSMLPAIVTTLLGAFCGSWIRSEREDRDRLIGLFVAGNVGLLLGYILTAWMPYNKNLWTVSYTFHTAGLAMHVLGMLYFLVDMKGFRRFLAPVLVYGTNAIFVYICSETIAIVLWWIKVATPNGRVTLYRWLYESFFLPWFSPINASLAYAVTNVLLLLVVTSFLYRRRIFLKI